MTIEKKKTYLVCPKISFQLNINRTSWAWNHKLIKKKLFNLKNVISDRHFFPFKTSVEWTHEGDDLYG